MTQSPPPPFEGGGLTRDMLLAGGLAAAIRKAQPDAVLLTDEERSANLAALLAQRPDRGQGVWVFAYGSLIWNPAIHITERRLARLEGWHRSFCLATKAGRGDAATPGMLLGLEPGGTCVGAVLHVAEADVETELEILWRREMVGSGYVPRWLTVSTLDGAPLGTAIAFTINHAGPGYACNLPHDELVRRLAHARGLLGTNWDYLANTREGLRRMGIADEMLDHMAAEVEALRREM